MTTAIEDLVRMNDVATLLEIMEDERDEFLQMDAAEGLVQLGNKRGLEYLTLASESEEKDVREYAREILDSADVKRMKEQIVFEQKKQHQARILEVKKRLAEGKKVFLYRVIPITPRELIDSDPSTRIYDVPLLNEAGWEGWEAVNLLPPAGRAAAAEEGMSFIGAYVLMKKEVTGKDSAELERLIQD